jgi:hypothetical protein
VVRGKEEGRRLVSASGLRWTMRRPGGLDPSGAPDGEDPWLCDAGFHRLCLSQTHFTSDLETRQDDRRSRGRGLPGNQRSGAGIPRRRPTIFEVPPTPRNRLRPLTRVATE